MISKEKKTQIIQKFGGTNKNSGLTEVQVAILTAEIEDLKSHFENNKKDLHSKRGFMAKINKRKSLLQYLKNDNYERYSALISQLKLRK